MITFVIIWISILYVAGISPVINWEAIKVLPEVVSIYVILHFIFTTWLWRAPILQGWLILTPVIQGTWSGTIETTWIDPKTNKQPPPISVFMAIRQTNYSMSIIMFTEESQSTSLAAQFSISEDGGTKVLSYNYQNTPSAVIRDQSQVHAGAATLRLSTKPTLRLDGEYWTDRKTTGQIKLQYVGKEPIERFPSK